MLENHNVPFRNSSSRCSLLSALPSQASAFGLRLTALAAVRFAIAAKAAAKRQAWGKKANLYVVDFHRITIFLL